MTVTVCEMVPGVNVTVWPEMAVKSPAVAEPFAVVNVTEVLTSTACESVIVNVIPFPSMADAFAMLKTALSSLVMVPVAEALVPEIEIARPPLTNPPSVAVRVSFASIFESEFVLTEMVFVTSPA